MRVALEFKPRDLWVGVYWARRTEWYVERLHVWVCLLPCFPLHLTF